MSQVIKLKYCANGEWKESKTQKYMPVTNSSTGEVIAEPCCTSEEVYEAIGLPSRRSRVVLDPGNPASGPDVSFQSGA